MPNQRKAGKAFVGGWVSAADKKNYQMAARRARMNLSEWISHKLTAELAAYELRETAISSAQQAEYERRTAGVVRVSYSKKKSPRK